MVFEGSPAVARHRLRLALRKAREAKDLTQGQVAESLDWSLSKLQRIEAGDNSISPTDTRALLGRLGVTDASTVEELVTQARAARRRGTWDEARYREHLPDALRKLLQFESQARIIRTFQTVLVPGALQTPALAEHVLNAWEKELDPEERTVRLEVRLGRRHHIFERPDPPEYRLILDESVLFRTVGGPLVFAEQLRQLLDDFRAGRIDIRVAPFTVSAIVALSVPFAVLTLDDDQDSVLYRESHLVDELVQVPEKVHRHLELFSQVWNQSLSGEETEHLIETRISDLLSSPDREKLESPT